MKPSSDASGLHVYCVVAEDVFPPEALEGLAGRPVRSWAAAGLRAWASERDEPPPRDAALVGPPSPPDPELLRRHHDVVLAAFRAGGVVPVRFGQWLPDGSALVAWLERDAGRMRQTLERLGDAAEFGVRFHAPPDGSAPTRTGEAAPGVAEAAAASDPREPRRYLRTLARRRSVRRDALARREAVLRRLSSAIGPLVRDQRVLPVAPGDLAAVAHLIDRGRVESYREAVLRFLERQAPNGAEVTGPWPPWSFVT